MAAWIGTDGGRPVAGSRSAVVVVDVANVVGCRPDGWWRDRVGAASRVVAAVRDRRWTGQQWADRLGLGTEVGLLALVVEGQARAVGDVEAAPGADPPVRLVVAPGSGDDAIAELVRALSAAGGPVVEVLVVTSDRALAARVAAAGARSVPAGRFRDLLDGPARPDRPGPVSPPRPASG